MKVSVIIPSWNGKELLAVSLRSLAKQTFKDFEVIVVDNGSTDETVSFTKNQFPKIKVVQLAKNYGFAKAVNEGIKQSRSKYLFLLNNDTRVDRNCLKYLVEAADKQRGYGMVAAKMLNFNNPRVIDGAGDL